MKTFRKRHSKPKKHNFATFDIESNNWIDFEILGFYDGKEYKEFTNIPEFLKHILRRKYYGFRFYAHFGGKYDALFLLEHLQEKDVRITDINGVMLQIDIGFDAYKTQNGMRYKNHIYIRDSYRLLPASLKKLTETFNVQTKKGSFDFSKRVNKNDKELREYLKSDVIGLYEVITKFTEIWQNLGGEIKLTLPSSTMDLFQRKYLSQKIEIKSYFDKDTEIRKSYYGGRVEVYKKHGYNLNYYDFNSLYPSVMKDNYFPGSILADVKTDKYKKGDFGIFEIEAEIKNYNIPPLPVKIDNMLLFPVGIIKGFYPSPFVDLLHELKIPFQIKRLILFEKIKLFENFVSDLYKMRMDNKDNSLNFICKIALNSLYGKFGQQIKRKMFIKNPSDLTDLTCYNETIDLWYKENRVFLNYCLPAISAFVTTYAQIKLYKAMMKAGFQNVYYVDTDSIFTTAELKTSNALGELKLEDRIKEAIFISQKLYAYENQSGEIKIKSKGFTSQDLSFDYFKQALQYEFKNFVSERETVFGYKESLKRFDKILTSGNKVKSLQIIDTKRAFVNNESFPFIL